MDTLCADFAKLDMGVTPVVIDIECFRYSKEKWIVKEMAVSGPYLDSVTFGPPFPASFLPDTHVRAYTWLTDNLHGLMWDIGDLPYEHLALYVESIKLRHPITHFQFYAKGLEKCKYLSSLFDRPFINLDELRCPVASAKKSLCSSFPCKGIHMNGNHCARNKAAFHILPTFSSVSCGGNEWPQTILSHDCQATLINRNQEMLVRVEKLEIRETHEPDKKLLVKNCITLTPSECRRLTKLVM